MTDDSFFDFMMDGGAELFPELMGGETYDCPFCSSKVSYYEKVEIVDKTSFRCPSCGKVINVSEK